MMLKIALALNKAALEARNIHGCKTSAISCILGLAAILNTFVSFQVKYNQFPLCALNPVAA